MTRLDHHVPRVGASERTQCSHWQPVVLLTYNCAKGYLGCSSLSKVLDVSSFQGEKLGMHSSLSTLRQVRKTSCQFSLLAPPGDSRLKVIPKAAEAAPGGI